MTIEKIACPVLNHYYSNSSRARVEVFVKFAIREGDNSEPETVPVAIICPYYNPSGECGITDSASDESFKPCIYNEWTPIVRGAKE